MMEKIKIFEKETNIRQKLASGKTSPFNTYKKLTVGNISFPKFLKYELFTSIMGPLPGGLGYFVRKLFYPSIVGRMGKGVIIGRNVIMRHPQQIYIGDYVTIDDNCVLDARGSGRGGLVLENNVLVNRNCMLLAKNGYIRVRSRSSIGSNTVIVSMDGVEIGEAVLFAGGCYLSAGNYEFKDSNTPVMDQQVYTKGPITIGTGAWLGTRATILDGVKIGAGAIIGAGAVVMKEIPQKAVAVGVPARIIRIRS